MKIILYLLPVCLLFHSGKLFAQLGFHAGPSFASANQEIDIEGFFSDDLDWENRVGVNAGFFYRLPMGKLALQPEFNFVQKGGKTDLDGEDFKLFVNYLEVPVYLVYNGGKNVGFYGGLGPSFNYGVSGNAIMGEEEEGIKFGSDQDLARCHIGLNGMAGYQFSNGFGIDAFFSQSLTSSNASQTVSEEGMTMKISTDYNFFNWGIRFSLMIGNKNVKK
jgi:hypothetical protein